MVKIMVKIIKIIMVDKIIKVIKKVIKGGLQEEKEKGDSCTSVSFKALILLAKRDKKSIMANRKEA